MGVFRGLDPGGAEAAADEARLVAAQVRLGELVLRQRADAQQQVELVAEMRRLAPVVGRTV